jgi:SH3 domain-containing YSC84-like protein 1
MILFWHHPKKNRRHDIARVEERLDPMATPSAPPEQMTHFTPTIVALPPAPPPSGAPPLPPPEEPSDLTVATLSSPWAYDEEQAFCANCRELFTPLNRRHHCRLCGKIFCNNCSKQKALIPPSSIVLSPTAGKKARLNSQAVSFQPDEDPDRMLTTYRGENKEVLYGKGLEERFLLAREPLRVCRACFHELQPVQEELRNSNSNAMRFNHIDPTDPRRLFNSPLAFTLGHEVRKAAYTLNNLLPLPKRMGAVISTGEETFNTTDTCKDACRGVSPSLGDLDGVRIPARLLKEAKGVAVLTVVKGGFGLAGVEFGTGLVVARLGERWSAPSAIGTAGLSWGGTLVYL